MPAGRNQTAIAKANVKRLLRFLGLRVTTSLFAADRWSTEKTTAINQLAMWPAETFSSKETQLIKNLTARR